jgi:hypothetical protein
MSFLRRSLCVFLYAVVSVLTLAAPAVAQSGRTNRQFVHDLFFQGPVDPQEMEPANAARIEQAANDSANEIAKLVGFGISSLPLGSSSAGFSYFRDPATGELSLKSRSFGPVFAERPLTNGRGVLNVGFSYQHATTEYSQDFDTADGRDTGIPVFDNIVTFRSDGLQQFITRRSFLESVVDTYALFASVGVTDRIDVGVTVPIVSVELNGSADDGYDVTRTYNAPTPQGASTRAAVSAPAGVRPVLGLSTQSASGIGDIVLRSKIALTSQRGGEGVAVAVDVTVPTGDEEEFLGRGNATGRVLLLASKAIRGRASAYGNAGYRFGEENKEAQYVAGMDVSLLPRDRLTVAVSFLGRSLQDASSLERQQTVQRVTNNLGNTPAELSDVRVDRFFWNSDTINFNQLATEFKVHLGGQWLATGAVLFPLNNRDLQPKPVTLVGLEWAGGR